MSHFNSLRTAAEYAGVTYQSIRTWSKEYGIGRIGDDGRWRIDKGKLDQVIATRDQIAELQDSLKRLG